VETGFKDSNWWLEWIRFTVKTVSKSDCYACGSPKPTLITTPFPLNTKNSRIGWACMILLFASSSTTVNIDCLDLHYLYHRVTVRERTPPFQVVKGPYSCISRKVDGGMSVGVLSHCSDMTDVTTTATWGKLMANITN
ncbi:hypothetical protein DPEC_G00261270, partial [Dallia pectoralis]